MRSKNVAKLASVTLVATLLAGASGAQDATDELVIFDNAIDPAVTDMTMAEVMAPNAADAMFVGWQISYQMYRDGRDAGMTDIQLTALQTAADAAGAAYEAALIAQNTLQVSAVEPQVLSDEMFAELFITE